MARLFIRDNQKIRDLFMTKEVTVIDDHTQLRPGDLDWLMHRVPKVQQPMPLRMVALNHWFNPRLNSHRATRKPNKGLTLGSYKTKRK